MAISLVVFSNWMYINEVNEVAGLRPFNVKSNIAVALLLAPGGVAAIIHYFCVKR